MNYPQAVIEKAQNLEQLLKRITAGATLGEANQALGFDLDQEQLERAQVKHKAGGCRWEALIDGRHGHAQKIHSGIREWLYNRKDGEEEIRAPQLVKEIAEKFGVEVTPEHINYLLRKRGLTAPVGRPYKQQPAEEEQTEAETNSSEPVDNAGIFFSGESEGGNGGGARA
jgi:transposase